MPKTAILVCAVTAALCACLLSACSQSGSATPSNSAAQKQNQSKIEVIDEYIGEWKPAVILFDSEVPPEAPQPDDEDWTITVSKDGVVRFSTGETYVLRYPKDASGQPDSHYDYYFVEEGLPASHDSIMYDTSGTESVELWETHNLNNGQRWSIVYTRDGSHPMQDEATETPL